MMTQDWKPTLCLDFDGVLHAYGKGWEGPEVISGGPVPGAEAFLRRAMRWFNVFVYSCRSHHAGGIDAMRAWCQQHFAPDVCLGLHWATEKPPAHVTLDDRALTFTGEWPRVEDLRAFTPWNREPEMGYTPASMPVSPEAPEKDWGDELAFQVTVGDQEYKIFANGRIEGFGDSVDIVVMNRLPTLIRMALTAHDVE